jgi:hypothetical protein
MGEIILRPSDWVTAGLVVAIILLFVRTIILSGKLKRLRRSYLQFMSQSGVEDMEQVVISIKERLASQEQEISKLQQSVNSMGQMLKMKKGNVSIHRYNAFGERGNDLSFSLAIVNDQEDGMVLSGLHSREQTFIYAKPVKQGESPYPLTPEEKQAINQALRPE